MKRKKPLSTSGVAKKIGSYHRVSSLHQARDGDSPRPNKT